MHTDNKGEGAAAPSLRPYLPEVIRAGRVELLYRQALPGFAVTLAVATICLAALWDELAHAVLFTWYGLVWAVIVARLLLVRRYRARPAGVEPRTWENWFVVGSAASGILWGALAALTQPSSYTHDVFVAFVVGGMSIGAMGMLGASRKSFFWFAAPMLGAQTVQFLWYGTDPYRAMAALVFIFFLALAKIYNDYHRAVVQNIERGVDNERLLAEQRGLLDAATIGIAFVRDHTLVDCNAEFERILGGARAEIVGASTRAWFPDAASWEAAWGARDARQGEGQVYRRELQLARRDGRLVWCDVSSCAIVPGEPELGQVVVCVDIEERKSTEAALRASTERLDLVVRASQSGLWDWEVETGKRHVSPRFKEILGYPADADLLRIFSLPDRLHPDDRDPVLAAVDEALAGGAPFDQEARLRRADNTWVWVHGRAEVTRDPSGKALRFTGSIIDISDRKHVEARLRESEQHFRHLVETANDLVWAIDREGRWSYLSPRATRQVFDCEPEHLVGKLATDAQPPEERKRTAAVLARVLDGFNESHFETAVLNRKGERVALSLNATSQRDASGAVVGATGTATDLSPLKVKEAELIGALAEQELIFESASEGIVFVKKRLVHKANSKFAAMLGYEPQELAGQPTIVWFAHPSEWEPVGKQERATLARDQIFQSELLVKRKTGETFWCEIRGRAVRPEEPDAGSIWVYIDISARKEREQRIQHLADHDALTGLLNRRLLEDRLRQAIGLARRHDKLAAIMLIDLDGFKQINDGYGHLTGDFVLRTVAKRLKECVRETDTVARLGGDEFVVLLTGQKSPEDSAVVAEKILTGLTAPIAAGGRDFQIGASIGISVFPRDGLTPEALIKHADAAMYRVKEAGKNRYQFYSG